MSIIENYYSKTINALDDNDLQSTLKSRFENYKYNITQYAKFLKEREEITHHEAVTQGVLEVAQKDHTKWSMLTAFFGVIAVIALIVFFIMPKSFVLLLISGGVTAVTSFMYNDSKKTIAECQSKNSRRSDKEKEISELRNIIIKSASVEDIL